MALGIILGSGFSLWFIFFLCLCIVFFIFSIVIIKDHGIRDRRVLIFFLMILGFLLGMIRIRDIKYDESMVPEFDGAMKKSSVTGKVCDISYSHEQYLITLSDIHIDLQNPEPDINLTDEHDPDMKVLVYSEFPTNVLSGDLIHVKGTLYSFQQATNYGQFDQRKYYYSKNIFIKFMQTRYYLTAANEHL